MLNKKGKIPYDVAKESNHEECARILDKVSSPPDEPVIEDVLLAGGNRTNAVAIIWKNPRPFNYYPAITAIEVQLKQQRLFDQWKTVGTNQMGDSPRKEKTSKVKLPYENGELTDFESDSEMDERNEIEMNCLCMSGRENKLDLRFEVDNQEYVLPRYYTLRDLVESTKYVVRVRVANKYGWGMYSTGYNFCIREMITEFKVQDIKTHITRRNKLMIQQQPAEEKPKVDWSSVNDSMISGLTEALDTQRSKKATSANATETLTRILSEGVDYLNLLLEDNHNLSEIRNANGMSLLHAAAASTSPHAMTLIMEVVNRNLLSVNDRSKVWLHEIVECRTDPFLFISLFITIISMPLCS